MSDKTDGKEEISEDELDQIIQDMAKDDGQEKSEPVAAAPVKPALELVQSMKKAVSSAASQQMTLELNGVVNLKLCFKNGERSIEVVCTEEHLL